MKTTVVDIHKVKDKRPEFDVYIGRALPYYMDRERLFTKFSKWFNPRLDLEEYEGYMRNLIRNNPEKYNLEELRGKKLGCWCITTSELTPLVCHGQVLMKLLREKQPTSSR